LKVGLCYEIVPIYHKSPSTVELGTKWQPTAQLHVLSHHLPETQVIIPSQCKSSSWLRTPKPGSRIVENNLPLWRPTYIWICTAASIFTTKISLATSRYLSRNFFHCMGCTSSEIV